MEKCKADNLLKVTNTVKTESREELLRLILDSESPMTASDLHNMVKDKGTDLATVYRALKVFTEKGLVRTVHAEGSQVFYEKSCEHNPPHPHFFCESCGKLECMKPYGFDESALFMRLAKDRDVRSVELVMKGRCTVCTG
ncbi:MAG: Fur family transcriptional regulator [Deferribacterales bacterium]